MIEAERALATNRAGWDRVAPRFHGSTALPEYGPLAPSEDTLRLLDPTAALCALELGCGSGHSLRYLAERGARELWGVDLSAVQIAFAQETLRPFASRCRLFESAMEVNPGIPAGHFDLVFSIWGMGWTTDLPATLALVAEYLRPGGSGRPTTRVARQGILVMDNPKLLDELFATAVAAIDAGDVPALERLLTEHPALGRDRLDAPGAWLRDKVGHALDGFFQQPYLLWFVAEDPVRNGKLPANIADVARTIVRAAKREGAETLPEQLDYALRLVSWSWIARDCHVQIDLVDVLIDAGASPDGRPDDALVNGNFAAAEHLVERGAKVTLSTALCLARWDDVSRLGPTASARDKQFGFILAALKGRAEALAKVIDLGVDLNAPCADLYSHATALHHAVYSGSLDAVKVLVGAGAALDTQDSVYGGTPLGWADYGKHDEIAKYLRERAGL